jgi:murein DD-endopeptidase MepM/ murein hydrolase activator NlpD
LRVWIPADRGFREAARVTGVSWQALFLAFRSGPHVRRVSCEEHPEVSRPEIEILVGDLSPEGARVPRSFFQRMPMDQWTTPYDGVFGCSRSGGRRRHKGIDMHAPEGTPLYTVAGGRVYRAWKSKGIPRDGGYGNYVILEHDAVESSGLRYWTYYTHMQNPPQVTEGDRVPAGFRIGEVGRTPLGRFQNAHLHFEVRLANGSELGVPVNLTPFGGFRSHFTSDEGAY